jgi:arylsulfatase A-like enzyme
MNVLILCSDQLRADYLGCYGHNAIGTKHIDGLAAQGVRFARAYCAAPLCGPSRISFVTSTRVSEHGHRNYGSTIDFGVPNLVRSLKEAGCRTAMFGKNHCFNAEQMNEIWGELREVCVGNYDAHPSYRRSFDAFPMAADDPLNIDAGLADDAADFLRRQTGGQPFVCWVNWQSPHPAFTCPEPYFSMFDPAEVELPPNYRQSKAGKPKRLTNWQANSQAAEATDDDIRRAIAAYMGQVRYIDDCVGTVLRALTESGRDSDTLVLVMADHGELLGSQGAFHKVPVFYEPLVRIPVIIRHPDRAYRGVFEGLVEEVDLAPTILEALGLRRPLTFVGESLHGRLCEGRLSRADGRETAMVEAGVQAPVWPGPYGEPQKAPFAPNNFGPGAMITDGRRKLSVYADDEPELYDLEADPEEWNNAYGSLELKEDRERLTLDLCRRLLGAGVRDIGRVFWPEGYGDPRDAPLETAARGPNPQKVAADQEDRKTDDAC